MNRFQLIALCFLMGCVTSTDASPNDPPIDRPRPELPSYGTPTDATTIHLLVHDGFAGSAYDRELRIEGTAATYRYGANTEQVTISTRAVKEIIHALEEIEFLELDGDYDTCSTPASDGFSAAIEVALPAGPQTVSHYGGCSGGVFDELTRLEQRIFDLSGFTAWPGNL